jgi:ATP-dependent helicase/nuclease subunit B
LTLTGDAQAAETGRGRVFSIAPGAPFLKILARSLVDGELIPGFVPRADPLLLADVTIYLPTRRAARALGAEFIDAFGGRASLLPVIRTLGDGDADEFDFSALETGLPDLAPPIGDLERRLHLARLVRSWTNALSQANRALFKDEDIAVPSSAADAIRMAGDLARLMDSMATEEVGWQALEGLAGEAPGDDISGRWAQWWNYTLHFLKVVTEYWPQFLLEAGRSDPARHRGSLLDLRTQRLAAGAARGPVIAAGSTGSIPATARLIAAIARLKQGAVVLPGVDLDLDDASWEMLTRPDVADGAASTHPQHGLARLLKAIGIGRGDIAELGRGERDPRMGLIGKALLPAARTGQWAGAAESRAAGSAGQTALVEAPDNRLEALAIAIALRETLEEAGRTAALVTPDRVLAQRVSAELSRFGIAIDDSAGTPLSASRPAAFARLVLSACCGPADPVTLAALVKHPVLCGAPGSRESRIARMFELAALRDAIIVPRPGVLADAARSAFAAHDRNPHAPAEVRDCLPDERQAVIAMGAFLDAALSPLLTLVAAGGVAPVAGVIEALRLSVAGLISGARETAWFSMPGASELQRIFDAFSAMEMPADPEVRLEIEPGESPEIFDALITGETVRAIRSHHPRLAILGPLEARLQHFDRIILGGLNEGTWPGQARNDPFLNRPMKSGIGLSTPERRIGQAAHDFQQLSGPGDVIYTRSLRAEGAPTVASRWLQRLTVVAGETAAKAMRAAGARYVSMAEGLDRPHGERAGRVARPNPKPPVELRPAGLSVTDIETWIRDPYAIHARHILGLRPLPPLEREADALMRGQLYHAILARHVTGGDHSLAGLEAIARAVFAENNVPPEVAATWLPRFMAVARLFVDWEAGRRDAVTASHCEVSGRIAVADTGFTLRGRADRIDDMADGTLSVIDYKTGLKPSVNQARTLSPQLALEGRMAELGAFALPPGRKIGDLAYVRLRKGDRLRVDHVCNGQKPIDPRELAATAWSQLQQLIVKFQDPGWGYISRRAPSHEGDVSGDYDHLARVREWSSGDPENDDA